jgi:hypothetical protein
MVGLSARTIEAAKSILGNGIPDLLQAVEDDQISISDAARAAKELPEDQRQAVKAVQNGEARAVTETIPTPEPHPTPVPQPEAPARKPTREELLMAK